MSRTILFTLCGVAFAAALPAHAQVSDDDIVVVASGVPQPAEETGRSVTRIDRATIETRQTIVLTDLLATTPGVTVSRNGGAGAVTAVRLRGAEDAQTLVLIDGVRANDPSSPGGAYDFGNLLAGSIERVEVLRGPNSVVWGSQAIGGVVNVVTQAPVDGIAMRANAEYGYADQVSANTALAVGDEHVQGALTGGYLRTDGISQAASGTEPDGYRQAGASGRLKVELAPGFGADLRGYFTKSRLEIDGFPAPAYTFTDTDEFTKTQEIYGYAGLYAQTGPVEHHTGFTLADINRDSFDPATGSAPIYFYRGRSERYAYRGDAVLAEQVRLTFGGEHENQRFYDGSATYRTGITSFFGEAIISPVERVTVTAGVRTDDHDRFGNHTSLGANLAVRPIQGMVLRASYGEGFKAPTLYQLYAPFYGTATLAPEAAKSYEAGIEQRLAGGRVTLGATWYHRDTRNQIDFDLNTYTYANIARTRAEGIELEASARPIDALTLSANYTLTDTENRSAGLAGKELARRPREVANLSVDYRLPFGLALGGTASIVGRSFNDAGNTTRLDGYTLIAVRAEMPVSDRFAVYGRVENLTDEKYETVRGYGTYGRAAYAGVRIRLD